VYDNAITLKRARRNNLLDHWMKTINKKLEATCDADQFFENFDQVMQSIKAVRRGASSRAE
jgi:cell fate (sporulation/competence/biofilm development) regulator YlbF (YheA/YmcA/DUF963 family)